MREIIANCPLIRRGNSAMPLFLAHSPVIRSHVDRAAPRVLEQLGEDADAVVRREGPEVNPPAVVVGEQHEPQVFDPVPLDVREREDHDLRLPAERRIGQVKLIIRLGRRDQDVAGLFQEPGSLLFCPGRSMAPASSSRVKRGPSRSRIRPAASSLHAECDQVALEQRLVELVRRVALSDRS